MKPDPPRVYENNALTWVSCLPLAHPAWDHFHLDVTYHGPGNRWAVCRWGRSQVCTRTGSWSFPTRSPRSEAWKRTHEFPYEEALEIARREARRIVVAGLTVQDVLDGKWHG